MDAEVIKDLAIALTITLGTMVPAMNIGKIGSKGLEAMGRNPEASSNIQTGMILSIAFVEAIAIYCLVVAIILKFV